VSVTSVADPTKSASATVAITAALAVILSISPASASVSTSGTQLFTASLTGSSNTAVTWSLSGAGCSGSACGSLATSALSAVYSAPPLAPSVPNVTVVVTSEADPSKSASASVAIVPLVAVSVAPDNASVTTGTTQQFNATVTGTSNTTVAWNVSGAGCGGAACGTINSGGLFTAPAAVTSPPTVTVTATSVADQTKSGSANVTLSPTANSSVTVTVQPNGSITAPFSPLVLLPGGKRRLYANVCAGSNALDCGRPSDISVAWQASCGALGAVTGPYVDYTAPISGGPCTITATNPASGVAATATATIANPVVRIDVIPAATTLYMNQYALLQAIVTGSVNRDVTWSLTSNPGNAGTLTAQGWTATFSANAAGTYTATATSIADGTKAAVITINVTSNAMPATATANHTEPVDCTATGSGTTYEVGPARAYTTINAVPWYSLKPGDTVRIHNDGTAGNPTVYAEKWNMRNSGTASQPIRVCGVPANNQLPVISGNGATTGASLDYGILENYALLLIYDHRLGNANYGSGTYPQYITIEGLAFSHATGSYNYVPQAGGSAAWAIYSSALWFQGGAHVTFRGNDVEDTSEGVFSNAQTTLGENSMTRFFLVEGNYIGNNGVSGVFTSHQIYAQSFGQVIQGNYFDEPKAGMGGDQIKTRCTECIERYNYISGLTGGAHIFDLVAPQDSNNFTMEQELYAGGGPGPVIGAADVEAAEDWYGTHYVYGNIFQFVSLTPIHYTDDNCIEDAPGGVLYFYHNTAVHPLYGYYRWYMFETGSWGGPCQPAKPLTRFPGAEFTNNAILLSQPTTYPPFFYWTDLNASFLTLDVNWISSSWGSGTGTGDGSGLSYQTAPSEYQTGNASNHITGMANLLTGTGVPFNATTYVPTPGSPLIGAAGPLPAAVSSALPVTMQYNPSTYLMTPRINSSDIGAVMF
jgi:hypothetical protein